MLGNVFRDQPGMPVLSEVMDEQWGPYVEAIVNTLAEGWSDPDGDDAELRAMLRLVVNFRTWAILRHSGLDADRVWEVAARMVAGASEPGLPAPHIRARS